jgi:hypothetical protein
MVKRYAQRWIEDMGVQSGEKLDQFVSALKAVRHDPVTELCRQLARPFQRRHVTAILDNGET